MSAVVVVNNGRPMDRITALRAEIAALVQADCDKLVDLLKDAAAQAERVAAEQATPVGVRETARKLSMDLPGEALRIQALLGRQTS